MVERIDGVSAVESPHLFEDNRCGGWVDIVAVGEGRRVEGGLRVEAWGYR